MKLSNKRANKQLFKALKKLINTRPNLIANKK